MHYILSILLLSTCFFIFSCAEQQQEEVIELVKDSEEYIEKQLEENNLQWCKEHKRYHDISKEKYPCLKPKPY